MEVAKEVLQAMHGTGGVCLWSCPSGLPMCCPEALFEVGCGVGNTVFPIVRSNKNPNLYVYGCDFSSTAIDVLKQDPNYDEAKCKAFVCDITDLHKNGDFPIGEGELDVIVMIFVFSAIKPEKMLATLKVPALRLRLPNATVVCGPLEPDCEIEPPELTGK